MPSITEGYLLSRGVEKLFNMTKLPMFIYLFFICRDGVSKCGLFIAASLIMEMLKLEEKVDIFHIVKLIRRSQPQFIQSKVDGIIYILSCLPLPF